MTTQKLFIQLFILSILISSCSNVNNENIVEDTLDVASNKAVKDILDARKKESLLNETNLLKKKDVSMEINDLKKRLLLNPSDSLFYKLNFLSCKTDGERSAELGIAMVDIFEKHFNDTFEYLFKDQTSCLGSLQSPHSHYLQCECESECESECENESEY